MTLKERFRRLRNNYNATQEVFADKIDVPRMTVVDIERGKVFPNPKVLDNLHMKLQINLNWLICGTGKMKAGEEMSMVGEPEGNYQATGAYVKKYIESLEEIRRLHEEVRRLMGERDDKKDKDGT